MFEELRDGPQGGQEMVQPALPTTETAMPTQNVGTIDNTATNPAALNPAMLQENAVNGQVTQNSQSNHIDYQVADTKAKLSLVESSGAVESIQDAIIAHFIPFLNATLPADQKIDITDLKAGRQAVLQALREDRIPSAEENKFLLTLPSLAEDAPKLFNTITQDIHQKQILAVVTGFNAANWQDVTSDDLRRLISKPKHKQPDYRTPVGFAELRRRFLSEIQTLATPDQFDIYIDAMNKLEDTLYGDRFKYYQQFELMRKDAQAIGQDMDATLAVEANPEIEDTTNLNTLAPENTGVGTVSLTMVDEELRGQLLNRAVIEGDPWRQGGQDYELSVANLVSAGLYPTYEITVDNQVIYLSNLFELTSEQMAAIAFVPTNGGVKVRGYYRDKEKAIWRYLPDYVRDISGEGIDVFGIGFDERSTILPILLQSGLNQIERRHGIVDLSNTNPDFLFAGTAPAYASRQEFREVYSKAQLRGDFYREVSPQPFNAGSNSVIAPNRHKIAPQLLSVNHSVGPDFDNLMVRFSVYSTFAGQMMGEGYEAIDYQTAWLLFSDYRGRCYVANIELNTQVTSTGCRRDWLLATDISTPLYEVTRLADNYGDTTDTRANNHIGMWENYLSKVPLLQEYEAIVANRK